MPFVMHQWIYKDSQIRRMVTEDPNREEVVRVAIEAFGGTLHAFYFSLGEYDGLSISQFPDNETALACIMTAMGQGTLASIRSTVLLTPEESLRAIRMAAEALGGGDKSRSR